MTKELEADYLVDKLAGRLQVWIIGKNKTPFLISDQSLIPMLKERTLQGCDDYIVDREETLEEYKQRKEQSE